MKTMIVSLLTPFFAQAAAPSAELPRYQAACAVYRVDNHPAFLTQVSVDLAPGESKEVYKLGNQTLSVSWEKNSYLSLFMVDGQTHHQRMTGVAVREFPKQIDFVPGDDYPVTMTCMYPDPTK